MLYLRVARRTRDIRERVVATATMLLLMAAMFTRVLTSPRHTYQ